MNAVVTDVAPCRKRIQVEIPADKVNASFDESYLQLQENVQIKGFRRGYAPRRMLERKFHKDVAKDVRGKLFQDSLVEAMKENDLSAMGEPDIDVETLEIKPGEAFSFETEVDVRPKFDLPEYKGLKLTEKIDAVADEEIDEQIDNLRERFANYEPTDEKSKEDDILQADVLVKAGKEELVNEADQRIRISGDKVFGLQYKNLVKKLSGLKAEDDASLSLTLPDDFHREELRGKKAKLSLTVKQVLRGTRPEIDQSFAQRVGMDSVEALRGQIRANIESERKQASRQQLEQDAADALIAACSFDLPEEFMKRQTASALVQSTMQLARMGATREYLDEQKEELEETSKKETERNVRRTIIYGAIAEKEEVEVTEREVQAHLQNLAQAYQTTPAKMLKRIQDNNGLPALANEIRDIKVTQIILDSAEVTEAPSKPTKKAKKE